MDSNSSFGSLGDFFPEHEQPCRIRGCKNTVRISGARAMYNKTHGAHGGHGDSPMCDSCYALFQTLQDQELPCSRPGCDGKWVWNRFQQLEAHAQGHTTPPKGLCEKCRQAAKEKEDIEQPCRIRGCKNTWTWTRRMQMESKDGKPPRRLCNQCFQDLQKLEDKELPCRVKGCTNKVPWNHYQQLEHLRSGKSLDNPPARMCDECMKVYATLKPQEQPCRIKGCGHTWTYSPYEQLVVLKRTPEGKEPEPPKQMCKECFAFFNQTVDKEQPCANRGCDGKWVWTRAMQLGAHIHGKDTPPHRMCDKCQARLAQLKPLEIPCMEEGCKGVWIYSPEEQLKDELLKRSPEKHHCPACSEFLQTRQPQELVCTQCGEKFVWSVQEQLMTELGTFKKPETCAKCTTREISEIKSEPVIIPADPTVFSVKIPLSGPWNESSVIRDWPVAYTPSEIARAEKAARRIVCLGDEMTAAGDDPEAAWVPRLEALLSQRRHEEIALLNAGIPGCTTPLALKRFDRDVAPFAPEVVIVSCAFADTRRQPAVLNDDTVGETVAAATAALEGMAQAAAALPKPAKLLCWLPNPVYPQRNGANSLWRNDEDPDTEAVRYYESVLRGIGGWCKAHAIPCVDARALFGMSGSQTARSWMASWWQVNATGARNLAGWLAEAIQNEGLLG